MAKKFSRKYDIKDIQKVANEIIQSFDNKIFAFVGELGAGKTTLIKAITKELSVIDEVVSPTFSIINEYKNLEDKTIYHFDLYRIKTTDELFSLDIFSYFDSNNYCFIEWIDKFISNFANEKIIIFEIKKISKTERLIKVQ